MRGAQGCPPSCSTEKWGLLGLDGAKSATKVHCHERQGGSTQASLKIVCKGTQESMDSVCILGLLGKLLVVRALHAWLL